MDVLKRRRRGGAPADAPEYMAPPELAGNEFAVAAFEFVEVEATGIARLTGTWSGSRGAPVDMRLVLTLPQGDERHEFEALAEASGTERAHDERSVWQATFSVPRWVLARRGVEYALEADGTSIALPHPERHDGLQGHDSEIEPDDIEALRGRVRQAEAAISWTQRQLARERDARRDAEEERAAAEAEVAIVRPEIEEHKREVARVAGLEARLAELEPLEAEVASLAAERDRVEARVEALAQEREALATERDRLAPLEARVEELAAERDRLAPLEEQVAALAAERERLAPLEARVEDLTAELSAEQAWHEQLKAEVGELAVERDRLGLGRGAVG